MEKRKLAFLFIPTFLISACSNAGYVPSKLKDLGMSKEYAFISSNNHYYSDETTYDINPYIKDLLSIKNVKYNAIKSVKDDVFYFVEFDNNDEKEYAVVTFNVSKKETTLIERMNNDFLVENKILVKTRKIITLETKLLQEFTNEFDIHLTIFDDKGVTSKHEIVYDCLTKQRIYIGKDRKLEYDNTIINEEYSVVQTKEVLDSVPHTFHENPIENAYGFQIKHNDEIWDVCKDIFKDGANKDVKEIISSKDNHLYYSSTYFYIKDNELFISMCSSDAKRASYTNGSPSLIFKVDYINKIIDYIGYTPTFYHVREVIKI